MKSKFHAFGWLVVATVLCSMPITAQNLPSQLHLSTDGHRLISGGLVSDGLYDESRIQVVKLEFDQENYWQLLTNNYESKTDIPATMIVDGVTYENVGVRFRGNTSYQRVQGEKKSFNISLDFVDDDLVIGGYNTLNFNNAYEDPSFIREVLYLNLSRNHIPSAKANYIHLYINDESWGLYPNVQQLDGKYLKDWFLSNDGTRWRAEKTTTTGGGPGRNPFGTGTSSLNYLGADTSLYTPHYTLKATDQDNPWEALVKTCDVLNNVPLALLEDSLKHYLDIDRTLWYLAHEIVFADDDSYVNKGGMDYYLYWEVETGRMVPLEYDGNSCMMINRVNWSPFLNESDARYPLMNRLFAVPELRQRYLAHVRTIIEESLDQEVVDAKIDAYYSLIDSFVQADEKKIYTYQEFVDARQTLKNFISQRRQYLLSNSEVGVTGPEISSVVFSGGELEYEAPNADQEVSVTARVESSSGVQAVNLYYGTGIVGSFEKTVMYDDGNHGDGDANDGLFGGSVPGFNGGTYVRLYIEAVANDNVSTVSYMPKGAEHDVYFYRVETSVLVDSDVVINEFVASNDASAADQDGEYDDWIELYNNSDQAVDLSGWYMSDDEGDLTQWTFPNGTTIPAKGYLIVWADEDLEQTGLHADFKLSASGEVLLLVQPDEMIADRVEFGEQSTDVAYARVPNGTGSFMMQAPTFNKSNESLPAGDVVINEFVASNDASAADQDGEYDDWIELYNNSDQAVDLSGWYMSDDEGDLTQWTFPNGTTIPAKGYLIVWADEDLEQTGLHADFKLSASGEVLLLVQPDEMIADRVEFGEQSTDVAYARVPNGTGSFMMQAPTFNENNEGVSSVEIVSSTQEVLRVYPNPVRGILNITASTLEVMDVEILNTLGVKVADVRLRGESSVDVSNLPAGVYFVKAGNTIYQILVQ